MDPILDPAQNTNYTVFPITRESTRCFYDFTQKAQGLFWRPNEVDLASEREAFSLLSPEHQRLVKFVLAFFAGADGIVLENLVTNFGSEVCDPWARLFYAFQQQQEAVHAEMYGLLIEVLIEDSSEKMRLFQAIENIPVVTAKADWAKKWMDKRRPFSDRLVAFAVVEGVYFAGAFAVIFWLKDQNLILLTRSRSALL